MNVNDTEILNSILTNSGYERTSTIEDANIVFLVTVSENDLPTTPKQSASDLSYYSAPSERMRKLVFGSG
jgi:tRNA A37 methylthiotransferase MiaB